MTAIAARRKRRIVAAMATSLLSLVSLPAGLVLGTNMLLNDSGGQNVETDDLIRIPDTPAHLVAVVNARDELASMAVVAMSPQGGGGTIVSMPVGTMADIGDDETPRRIADSYLTGGIDALRADVENALNISLDSAGVHTAADVATALADIGQRTVMMPQVLIDTGPDDVEVVVAEEGTVEMSPTAIAAGLAATRINFDELTRFAPVKALWSAIADAGTSIVPDVDGTDTDGSRPDGSGPDGSGSDAPTTSSTIVDLTPESDVPPTLSQILDRLLAGRVDVWQFSAVRVTDAQRNPGAADMYALDGSEVLMVMASVAPSALRVFSSNLAVMVDVPFNDAGRTQEAVTRLAYAGASIVLIRHIADAPAERTVAYVNDSIARVEVETYSDLIGPLEVVETIERIDGVNVRLVLGNDFVTFIAGAAPTDTTVEQ